MAWSKMLDCYQKMSRKKRLKCKLFDSYCYDKVVVYFVFILNSFTISIYFFLNILNK